MNPAKFAKAIVGGVIAGLAALIPLAADGISLVDTLFTASAVLAGFQVVYWTPNEK